MVLYRYATIRHTILVSLHHHSKNMETNRICLFNEVSNLYGSALKAEIDEIVWQMTHESQIGPLKTEELEYLYEETAFVKRRFYSLAENKEERMENVVREMKKYEPADKKSYEHVLVLIQTSKEHPLMMSELQGMNDIIEGFHPKPIFAGDLGLVRIWNSECSSCLFAVKSKMQIIISRKRIRANRNIHCIEIHLFL